MSMGRPTEPTTTIVYQLIVNSNMAILGSFKEPGRVWTSQYELQKNQTSIPPSLSKSTSSSESEEGNRQRHRHQLVAI